MIRPNGQCTGLQVERSRFETWPGQYDVFLSKTLSSRDASLHPGVEWMGAGKLSGKPDEIMGGNICYGLASQLGVVVILLVATRYMETRISSGWLGQ